MDHGSQKNKRKNRIEKNRRNNLRDRNKGNVPHNRKVKRYNKPWYEDDEEEN